MSAQTPSNLLLDQLRPNHLPEPVGLWPPAISWWVLAVITIILLVLISRYAWYHWQKNRYRSLALLQANRMFAEYQNHKSIHRLANESNELLKRVALHAFPGNQVAGLTGNAWSQFLADSANMPDLLNHSAFNNDRYNPDATLSADNVYELTRRWIKKHYV